MKSITTTTTAAVNAETVKVNRSESKKTLKSILPLLGCSLLLAAPANVEAINVDGKLEGLGEGYTQAFTVDFMLEDSSVRAGGELFLHETSSTLYVGFTAPYVGVNAINDNTWGANKSQGWIDAGVAHPFEKLQKSDGWKWKKDNKLSVGAGSLELELDYLADDNSQVATVKKFKLNGTDLDQSAITVASSLEYNLGNNPTAYQNDSFDFVGVGVTDWLYGVSYEWSLDKSEVNVGISDILANFGDFHMSPIMFDGKHNTTTTPPMPPNTPPTNVPDSGQTALMLGVGLMALVSLQRRMQFQATEG